MSQVLLDVWDLSFAQLHLTIYVIASNLSLSYCVTLMLDIPTYISVTSQASIYIFVIFTFTIVVLNWYAFTPYSIILSMSISTRFF